MTAQTIGQARPAADFDTALPSDRSAVAVLIGTIWFTILAGFIPDMIERAQAGARPYQPITHLHAFIAVSWLGLLTVQAALVRAGRGGLHTRIGRSGRWLGLAMLVVSVATAVSVDVSKLSMPTFKTQFLAFQISHVLVFAGLAAWAFAAVRRPGAHKRLILIATIALADAGTSRWIGGDVSELLGPGAFTEWALRYPIPLAMIAAIGAYDIATRGRLHPVFAPAAGIVAGTQLLAVWLYFQPGFIAATGSFLRMF